MLDATLDSRVELIILMTQYSTVGVTLKEKDKTKLLLFENKQNMTKWPDCQTWFYST